MVCDVMPREDVPRCGKHVHLSNSFQKQVSVILLSLTSVFVIEHSVLICTPYAHDTTVDGTHRIHVQPA